MSLGRRECPLGECELQLAHELAAQRAVGAAEAKRELRGMVEAETCRAGDFLERAKVGSRQHEIRTRRPPPAPSHGRAGDGAERDDHFAHRFDLLVRSNLHADVIDGPCHAPLNEDAVALEPHEPVHGLARGRDFPSDDVMRPT